MRNFPGASASAIPAGLFDRLRHTAHRPATPADYRRLVLEDLQDLLGTVRRWADPDLPDYGEICRSVLNYGIPPLAGRAVSRDTADSLSAEIREAILRFDPRFDPATLKVSSQIDPDRTPLDALSLQLTGHLLGFPKPVPFIARVAVDLESGWLELIPEDQDA